jgi:hypothetical protein
MANTPNFPWYDGFWLGAYYRAQGIIRTHAPEKLVHFEAEMDKFRTRLDFEVTEIPNIFGDTVLAEVRTLIEEIKSERLEKHEIMSFGRLVVHDLDFFTKLSEKLAPKVAEIVGEEVEPCYNFLSLYSNIGVCPLHMDTPQAKWTVDICIDQSFEWPIYFGPVQDWPDTNSAYGDGWEDKIKSDEAIPFSKHCLQPGNALLFAGSAQFHYRDRITRGKKDDFCNLVFFHYVPKGTLKTVNPKNWHDFFDIPELKGLRDFTSD